MDSEIPVQPKRAQTNAAMSDEMAGEVSVEVEPGGLKKVVGIRLSTSDTGGSGYRMCSGRGRSLAMALNERYRSSSSAELFARFGIGMW